MEPAFDDQLRDAVRRLLAGAEGADREYLELVYPIVNTAVSDTLGEQDLSHAGGEVRIKVTALDLTMDEALESVLDKLLEERVLQLSAVADDPRSYLYRAACNATSDLRRGGRPDIAISKSDRDLGEKLEAPDVRVAPTKDKELGRVEQAIAALPDESRVLLDAALGRIDEADISWIAQRRGLTLDDASSAVANRAAVVQGARAELERMYQLRVERRVRLQERLRFLVQLLAEREVVPIPHGNRAPAERAWPRRKSELRRWDDESLRELEAHILEQLKSCNRLLAEAKDALGKPLGTQPGWREIAVLIGAVAPDASEKELARAQNTIQVKVNRLFAKLAVVLAEEASDG